MTSIQGFFVKLGRILNSPVNVNLSSGSPPAAQEGRIAHHPPGPDEAHHHRPDEHHPLIEHAPLHDEHHAADDHHADDHHEDPHDASFADDDY